MVQLTIDLPEQFLDQEVRNEYTVTKERKEIWAVELDLLSQLQRVLDKYNLKYFAYAGTALGAIRHNGFIPWDDDIDLIMNREDFTKLCKVAKKEFKHPYFFQTEETDFGCVTGLAKLRNSNTTMILQSHKSRTFSFNQGMFIDIFVYDNIPNDQKEREIFFDKVEVLKAKSLKFRNTFHCDKAELNTPKGRIKNLCEKTIKFFHIKNPYYKKLSNLCQKYNSQQTEYVADLFSFTKVLITKKAWYNESVSQFFEFLSIPVTAEYEEYLSEHYGNNWRTPKALPPDHGFEPIIDTSKSYKTYKF